MYGRKEIMTKPPITANQRGRGAGIGNMNTLDLGLIIVSAPPRAKIAPDAPTAMEKGGAKSINRILPNIPPQK